MCYNIIFVAQQIMNLQNALVTSIYSQLLEEALANECITTCPGVQGSFVKEMRRDTLYWYWSGRDNNGVSRKVYIGPDNKETEELVAKLQDRKDVARQAIDCMKGTAAAYRGAGGQINEASHFKIIALLAQQNLFRKGVFVIGSHGFLSICNALGISASTSFMRTTDIDFARQPQNISLAIPDERNTVINIPEALKEFDKNFFLVPRLDHNNHSTSLQNNKLKVKVDFLTTDRGSSKPVLFDDIGIAAEPLRFMDYLLSGEPLKGLVIGSYAIPVNLPNAARFAIHKLIISKERPYSFKSKSQKDIAQASILLEYLISEDEEQVVDALSECVTIEKAIKNIKKTLPELSFINKSLSDFISNTIKELQDNALSEKHGIS